MLTSDYTRVRTATAEPITTAVMKNYIKENYGTDATEDSLIDAMIEAARIWIEDETRRAFVKQTVTYQAFDEDEAITEILMPYQPIIAITNVNSIDVEGTETTLTLNTDYNRIGLSGGTENILRIGAILSTVPVGVSSANNAIRVVFSAGYADNADIPEDVILGIQKLVAENYVNREASVDWSLQLVPYSVQQMINHYKVWDI